MTTGSLTRLEEAIQLAVRAHCGQVDKDGTPHIIHCFQVMLGVKKFLDEHPDADCLKYYSVDDMLVAAILHDTVEDSFENRTALERVDLHRIMVQFGDKVHALVYGVTRQKNSKGKNEVYKLLIYRSNENPGCQVLKSVDLTVNMARLHLLKDEKWKKKLSRKYNFGYSVLNHVEPITWEEASWQMRTDEKGKPHYYIDDGNGNEKEITETKFARLVGNRKKESASVK